MRLLDLILGNKKEKQRLERERLAELERQHKAEEARIAKEREARLAENLRKEAERQARLRAQAEKQRLEKLAAELSKDFGSPAYKEDRFSKMIRETSFNPFNLTCDPAANKNLQFGDMVSIFKNELNSNLSNAKRYGMPLKEALKGYVFNMIERYYNNAGYVPKAAADIIIEQIYAALQQTPYSNCIESEERLKYEMYWCFTHN